MAKDNCEKCGSPHPKCNGHNKKGKPCGVNPKEGFPVCQHHGGSLPYLVQKVEKDKQERKALDAVRTLALSRDVSPQQALINEVQRCAGAVAFISMKVNELDEEEVAGMFVTSDKMEAGLRTITKTASVNVWVKLLGEWSDRAARVAKMAVDAGVAERQIRVVEQQAALFHTALAGILYDLGVADHPDAPGVVRRHLLALPMGDD